VAALDELVRDAWLKQKCPDALPPAPPPPPKNAPPAGPHIVRVIPSSPDDPYNRIYALLLTAIDTAQKSVHLTMAYFAPGSEMVDALCDAAQRRVDVQLVLPSLSDFSPVLHAGRSYYGRLLGCGVKLHELQDAVLHAKTAVIDGVVSTVGSSNLDWRSFVGNNEVNAVIVGDDFGDTMERMFQRDVAASQQITADSWARRPLWQRTKESLARLFEAWW
jgi:cardiolipin synthase